jgi:hypothetical protein
MPVKLVSSTDTAYGGLCKRGDFVDIEAWKEGTNFQPVPMLMSEYLGGGAVAGPAAWYRKGQGITVTGSGVSQWSDASGNGRHLLQATDTNRPARQSDGTILFDGVDNYLKTSAFTLNQPITYYLALKQVTWTAGDYFIDGDGNTSVLIAQPSAGATPEIVAYAGSLSAVSTGLAVNTYGVICAVYNGASSVLRVNNGADITGNFGANNAGGLTLGGSGTVVAQFANIQVKEVIVFNQAHTAAQRSLMIAYLQTL